MSTDGVVTYTTLDDVKICETIANKKYEHLQNSSFGKVSSTIDWGRNTGKYVNNVPSILQSIHETPLKHA